MFWRTLAIVIVLAGKITLAEDHMPLHVFYLHFDVETYAPVTTRTIETAARCRFDIDPTSPDGKLLLELLGAPAVGGFDDAVVRLKIVGLTEGPVFVAKEGGILWEDLGRRGSMGDEKFGRLRNLMEGLSRAHRCGRYADKVESDK